MARIALGYHWRELNATQRSQFTVLFTAFIENALDAVHDEGKIKLLVRTAGDMLLIEVWDNGPGIPPELQARIFEPFFTTKGENGTGLGLWVANGIIDRSGGSILTRSSVHPSKHGTCFSIFLPAGPNGPAGSCSWAQAACP